MLTYLNVRCALGQDIHDYFAKFRGLIFFCFFMSHCEERSDVAIFGEYGEALCVGAPVYGLLRLLPYGLPRNDARRRGQERKDLMRGEKMMSSSVRAFLMYISAFWRVRDKAT